MKNYFITKKFTLIPLAYYKEEYLNEIFQLTESEEVKTVELPQYNAILSYAKPKDESNHLPLVVKLIESLNDIDLHNKLVVNYNPQLQLLHIVAAEEKRLLLANTFECNHANTILYYLTLVCQQVMFNTQITSVNIIGELAKEEEMLLTKYFPQINYIKQNTTR